MDLQVTMDQMWLMQAQLVLNFLAWAFAPELNEPIWSFNSQPLFLCQWPPDQVTYMIRSLEVNIQTEDHTLMPSNGWNGPEDPEAFGSTPLYSPSKLA